MQIACSAALLFGSMAYVRLPPFCTGHNAPVRHQLCNSRSATVHKCACGIGQGTAIASGLEPPDRILNKFKELKEALRRKEIARKVV